MKPRTPKTNKKKGRVVTNINDLFDWSTPRPGEEVIDIKTDYCQCSGTIYLTPEGECRKCFRPLNIPSIHGQSASTKPLKMQQSVDNNGSSEVVKDKSAAAPSPFDCAVRALAHNNAQRDFQNGGGWKLTYQEYFEQHLIERARLSQELKDKQDFLFFLDCEICHYAHCNMCRTRYKIKVKQLKEDIRRLESLK